MSKHHKHKHSSHDKFHKKSKHDYDDDEEDSSSDDSSGSSDSGSLSDSELDSDEYSGDDCDDDEESDSLSLGSYDRTSFDDEFIADEDESDDSRHRRHKSKHRKHRKDRHKSKKMKRSKSHREKDERSRFHRDKETNQKIVERLKKNILEGPRNRKTPTRYNPRTRCVDDFDENDYEPEDLSSGNNENNSQSHVKNEQRKIDQYFSSGAASKTVNSNSNYKPQPNKSTASASAPAAAPKSTNDASYLDIMNLQIMATTVIAAAPNNSTEHMKKWPNREFSQEMAKYINISQTLKHVSGQFVERIYAFLEDLEWGPLAKKMCSDSDQMFSVIVPDPSDPNKSLVSFYTRTDVVTVYPHQALVFALLRLLLKQEEVAFSQSMLLLNSFFPAEQNSTPVFLNPPTVLEELKGTLKYVLLSYTEAFRYLCKRTQELTNINLPIDELKFSTAKMA